MIMAYVAKGYYLEEFEIGKCYESVGRTITEADVVNFAGISGDFNPLHMDDEFAKNNMFGKRVAHGALGLIVSTGLSNQMGIFEGTTIAFLELTAKYTAPLCIGDTVHLEMTPTKAGQRHLKDHRKAGKPGRYCDHGCRVDLYDEGKRVNN